MRKKPEGIFKREEGGGPPKWDPKDFGKNGNVSGKGTGDMGKETEQLGHERWRDKRIPESDIEDAKSAIEEAGRREKRWPARVIAMALCGALALVVFGVTYGVVTKLVGAAAGKAIALGFGTLGAVLSGIGVALRNRAKKD